MKFLSLSICASQALSLQQCRIRSHQCRSHHCGQTQHPNSHPLRLHSSRGDRGRSVCYRLPRLADLPWIGRRVGRPAQCVHGLANVRTAAVGFDFYGLSECGSGFLEISEGILPRAGCPGNVRAESCPGLASAGFLQPAREYSFPAFGLGADRRIGYKQTHHPNHERHHYIHRRRQFHHRIQGHCSRHYCPRPHDRTRDCGWTQEHHRQLHHIIA